MLGEGLHWECCHPPRRTELDFLTLRLAEFPGIPRLPRRWRSSHSCASWSFNPGASPDPQFHHSAWGWGGSIHPRNRSSAENQLGWRPDGGKERQSQGSPDVGCMVALPIPRPFPGAWSRMCRSLEQMMNHTAALMKQIQTHLSAWSPRSGL